MSLCGRFQQFASWCNYEISTEKIALMADVEAMFHHLKVDPHNVDALRLLWYPEGDLNKEPEEFLKW